MGHPTRDDVIEVLTRIMVDIRRLMDMYRIEDFELVAERLGKPKKAKAKNPETAAFIRQFCTLYKTHMGKSADIKPRQVQKAQALVEHYGPERAVKIAEGLFLTDDEWIAGTTRNLDILYGKADWIDMKLREAGL